MVTLKNQKQLTWIHRLTIFKLLNLNSFVLPPVWLKGVQRIRLFKDQHQELVDLQQETVGAVLGEEASQQSLLLLTQGHFVRIWDANKWILDGDRGKK